MVMGMIDERNSCWFELEISGLRTESKINSLLDTGFNGYLCLPTAIAVSLGLELVSISRSELADGTVVEGDLVFSGKVKWFDETKNIFILLTKSDVPLLGTAFLRDSELYLNFVSKEARIIKVRKN